jgi:RND family efflux transporter MFP subunit
VIFSRVTAPLIGLVLIVALCSCSETQKAPPEQTVRGLRAYKVAATAESRVRRFPSILQPADVSRLSFEIAGQLRAITLEVGQKVQLGDMLAEIDPKSLQTQVEQAGAGVRQAQAQVDNADAEFERKDQLFKRGYATKAVLDQANAAMLTARAQLEQAQRQLDLTNHSLDRSKLLAPFSGTIAGVEVKSFAQVNAGQPIVTLYSDDRFEMHFVVPSGTFQTLTIGQSAEVKIADRPDLSFTEGIRVESRTGLRVSCRSHA